MLRTSSCSTVDRLAELAGGPRGSEAGIASLTGAGWQEEEAAQESSDNESDVVAAVLAAVRVSVNFICSVFNSIW